MFQAYKRWLDFRGRANRSEYWLFILAYLIALIVAVGLDSLLHTGFSNEGIGGVGPGVIYILTILGHLIPTLSVSFRRLHDTNRSAWWMLISLLPLVGAIVLFVFYLLPGSPGPNRFGAPPGQAPEDLKETFA